MIFLTYQKPINHLNELDVLDMTHNIFEEKNPHLMVYQVKSCNLENDILLYATIANNKNISMTLTFVNTSFILKINVTIKDNDRKVLFSWALTSFW